MIALIKNATALPAKAGIYAQSVTVAATHNDALHPVLCITWTMPDLQHETPSGFDGIKRFEMSRPDDSYLVLPAKAFITDTETDAMNTAWTLGAWDISRLEMPPLLPDANPSENRYGLNNVFGNAPEHIMTAASEGYVVWRFVPVSLCRPSRILSAIKTDSTIKTNGTRDGQPSARRGKWHKPSQPGVGHEHIYQLGVKR